MRSPPLPYALRFLRGGWEAEDSVFLSPGETAGFFMHGISQTLTGGRRHSRSVCASAGLSWLRLFRAAFLQGKERRLSL